MSAEGVRLARDALADIELVAQLRGAFAEAQTVMGHTLADLGLTEQRYHLLLVVAAGGRGGTVQGALARELHCPESRISLLVRELGGAGLVETLRDDADRRLVRGRGARARGRGARRRRRVPRLPLLVGGRGGAGRVGPLPAAGARRLGGVRVTAEGERVLGGDAH